jgi:class 3 adenylate cyclase/tetratricopeptide (TPR) repeat protein
VNCPSCAHQNPERAKFCLECGQRLATACPQCGTELPAGAKFCLECGHRVGATDAAPGAPAAPVAGVSAPDFHSRLASYTPKHLAEKILTSRSALEGERRQVTVLFSDVAGFTPLAEKLDPEDVHRIMNRCFELITAEVHRFEGTINQYTGDGVMALFGAPIAHEDGPRRAAHAALGIQRALGDYGKELRAQGGPELQMRIGINTGPVVVGRIGDDLRMDYTAVGDTTNLAARMQQIAKPGSVVVTDGTHKLISAFFETLDLGEVSVKGHTPVRAWEVLRPQLRRSRFDASVEHGLTPLVGRVHEVATLVERFGQVKAGRGQVILISGDAGIGKSRLLLEFHRRLAEAGEDVTWLEGQCISFGQSIPFLPLLDQLRENFGIEEFDGEPEIIAKVEHGMRRLGQLEPQIPYVRYLLSVDPGDPSVAAMEAPARRKQALEAMRALALRGAALRPIVFVFEDLHWIDASSEEYLNALMGSVAGAPIMIVLTYRVGYNPPFGNRSFYTMLALHTLSEAEALDMARLVLGTDQFPAELKAALLDKAEGVPLFVEEVTKTLLDLGVLRRENGGYRMVKGMGEVSVPDTIQGIIMSRLDRLGEDGKHAVQLASVIGRKFLQRLLERIAGLGGALEGLLQELKALEIVYEQGLLPEPAYIFKHAVIQDVAYNSLLKDRRRELHRAVGTAIEELYPDRLAEHCEELAHHFSLGEEWAKAFEYLAHSGDRAKTAYANSVALEWYARALEAAKAVPALPGRTLAKVHQRRSQILVSTARNEEAIGESQRMLDLARAEGDRSLEGEALADIAYAHYMTLSWDHVPDFKRCAEEALAIAREVSDERLLARTLFLIGSLDLMESRLTEASSNFDESLRVARAGKFEQTIVDNQISIGLVANWRADFRGAIATAREAELAARDLHDGYNEVFAMSNRCFSLIGLGEYREALALIAATRTAARERENRFMDARVTNTLGWLYQEFGDFSRARELDRESADLGHRIKNGNVEISALINVGFDDLYLGAPGRALPHFEETLVRVEKAFGAHRWRWTIHLQYALATTLLVLGRDGEALAQVDRGMVQAELTGSRKYVGWFHLLRGEIALRAGQAAAAAAALGQSLETARAIGYPTLTWKAAYLLGQARAAGGQGAEAREAAELAVSTIERIAAGAPEEGLRRTFLAWEPVVRAVESAAQLRRL